VCLSGYAAVGAWMWDLAVLQWFQAVKLGFWGRGSHRLRACAAISSQVISAGFLGRRP
jgi:hypothetical protein